MKQFEPHSQLKLKHQFPLVFLDKRVAQIASSIVVLLGCLVLLGWSWDIAFLKSVIPEAATMKANTAVGFILAGISLGLQTCKRHDALIKRLVSGCAIAVSIIGILTLCQYLFSWNLGIDELLFQDVPISPETDYPGRMGDNTALNFALTGLALWLSEQRTRRALYVAQTATLIIAVTALLALVGYMYDVQIFYRFIFYSTSMAVHTALNFLLLCVGILSLQSNYGWMQIVTSNSLGSIIARQLIPAALAMPLILGWLIRQGQLAGWYDPNFGLSLMVMSLVIILLGLAGRSAAIINKVDGDRKRSEDRLRSSKERLQLALQGANQGIWDWDLKTEVLTWDDPCKKIFGLTNDFPVTYQWHLDALHPDDRQRVFDAAAIALRDHTEFDEEYRTFHPDGTMRWIRARGSGYYEESGEPSRMSGTVLDISDRKQAEVAFKTQEKRYRYIFESAGVSIWEEDFSAVKTEIDQLKASGVDDFERYLNQHPEFVQWAIGAIRILDVNEITLKMTGAKDKEELLTSLPEIFLPETIQVFTKELLAIAAGETFFQSEVLVKTLRGKQLYVLFNITFPPPSEPYDRVLVTWSDISDRKLIETTLQKNEEQLRLALKAAKQGFYDLNVQTGETQVSPEYALMLGYDPETFVETNAKWRERLHPGDWESTSQAYEEYIASDQSEYRIEFRQRNQSGDWISILSLGKIVAWDGEGQPLRMLGTHTDITPRKQAEAELKERNEHLQILYEITRDLLSTQQPLVLVDALFAKLKPLIGLDIYFNYIVDEQQQKLHLAFSGGISDETAKAIEWLEMGQAICGTVAQQRCQIVQPNLQQSTDPKTELVRNLGLTAYSCQPLVSQGKLFGTLGFGSLTRTEFTSGETKLFQAICDRIAIALDRAEILSSLQQQTEELTKANRLKDEFLAALSHELRTPLNPILGWTQLLQTQNLTVAKTQEVLLTIERNAKQQIALVDDLLDVSRVVQGQFKLISLPVDLEPIINAARDSVHFAAIAKSLTLEFHYPTDPIRLMGDETRLQQVFWNLLTNAIKFTPDGGRIDLWLEQVENNAQIRITDTGIGISAEFLPYVFDRFRQADGSSTRQYGGLGLGLTLVKHLVELHGGTVEAESLGVGTGATFKVNLPILNQATIQTIQTEFNSFPEQGNLRQPPDDSSSFSSGALAGIRLLVVDDEPDNLDLLDFVLTQEGARITAVTSPTEALAIIAENPPDILITDIGMPEMDGYELLRQVRALPSQQNKPLKAIALTAFAYPEDQEKILTAGFQAYLSKPYNLDDLVTAIAEQVSHNP